MKHVAPSLPLASLAAAVIIAVDGAADSNVNRFSFSDINYELTSNEVPGNFCDPNSPLSLSGYFGVEGSKYNKHINSKKYFYWFFEKRTTSLLPDNEQPRLETNNDDEDIPFVIWLNGGPGCSSMIGLLQENGPCLVNKSGNSTTVNPYSWNEVAHVLYLDQPAKAGYSYGAGNDDDVEMAAEDAYYFLQSWFRSDNGEKYKELPIYLTGESYAGHYIPATAHRIWKGNQNAEEKDLLHLPLSGLAIGNGYMDIEEQVKWYPEMAYNNPHDIKIVDEDGYKEMKDAAKICSKDADRCNSRGGGLQKDFLCQKASSCVEHFFDPLNDQNISVYDISKPCIGDLCEDMTPIETFLNLPETKSTLGVPPRVTWEACDNYINTHWSYTDRVTNFAPYISKLLNDQLPVLIYSGDLDYICNFYGNRAVAMKLDWDHGHDFRNATDHDWNDGGGLARSFNGLSFLQVYDAGHMVPQDQPKQALIMIAQFLNGNSF